MFKKPKIISSLKKKTIYYQAHPDFPLLKEAYGETKKLTE